MEGEVTATKVTRTEVVMVVQDDGNVVMVVD
jgi:hypothetical protein